MVDATKRAIELRDTMQDDAGRALVVDFLRARQKLDIKSAAGLHKHYSTGEHIFRTKFSVNQIDPIAADAYKDVQLVDIRQMPEKEVEDLVKREKFDFPLWYKHGDGFDMKRVLDYNLVVILQLAGCNFHTRTGRGGCLYCYGDDLSNSGQPSDVTTWLTPVDTVDSMFEISNNLGSQYKSFGYDVDVKVLRISGGETTILPDFVLDTFRAAENRGYDFAYQIDSNLSTGTAIKRLIDRGVYDKHILERIAEYPVKLLAAIKGVSQENLVNNIRAKTNLEEQLNSIKLFMRAGIEPFFQMYNPEPEALREYLPRMDARIKNFSKRVHIGPLSTSYGTTLERVVREAKRLKKDPVEHVSATQAEWAENYALSEEVMHEHLRKNHGVGYKDTVRSDVKLEILK